MVRIRDKAHLPSTFARMGPAREIQLLTKSGVTPLQVSRFAADNAHANLSHQARGSLHGFAAFCELIKVRPFSPQEETTLRWISVFNDTATLGSYMALLAKACFSPRFSTTWLTHAVRHVARGLQKCQDRSFRFPNFIRIRLVAKISARESHRSEFAQALFSLSCSLSEYLRQRYSSVVPSPLTTWRDSPLSWRRPLLAYAPLTDNRVCRSCSRRGKTMRPAAFCAGRASATWMHLKR